MTPLVAYLLLFVAVGVGFIFVHLLAGKLFRPNKPGAEKQTIYECGEPTIGSAWIQFDLRFYVVALLFVIFDVEVAFFFPWAEVFGKSNTTAADTVMPSDYESMRTYSLRVTELGPETPESQAAALFRLMAPLTAADMRQLKAIADATPKGASAREELEAAHKQSRRVLENLPNTAANTAGRRVHLVILALDREDQWRVLRDASPEYLIPTSVGTNARELLRYVSTMSAAEYAEFRNLAVAGAKITVHKKDGEEVATDADGKVLARDKQVNKIGVIRNNTRAELAKLTDSPQDTVSRRAHLAVLLMTSADQFQAFSDRGVPLTEREFKDNVKAAGSLSWLALGEIALFFGILLVGFAYLWKRGDLAWVRSLQAERQAAVAIPGPPVQAAATAVVAAGEVPAHH
jgi:NADH:ubiquinone oxidoreductase subunit 3 (subunit A)